MSYFCRFAGKHGKQSLLNFPHQCPLNFTTDDKQQNPFVRVSSSWEPFFPGIVETPALWQSRQNLLAKLICWLYSGGNYQTLNVPFKKSNSVEGETIRMAFCCPLTFKSAGASGTSEAPFWLYLRLVCAPTEQQSPKVYSQAMRTEAFLLLEVPRWLQATHWHQ